MISNNAILKRVWPIVIQYAEAHRKPRWLPVAKSKIYRIPKRPVITEEERMELLRINNNYKTQMRAIRRFYHEDMIKEKSSLVSATSELSQRLEAEEWEQCVQLNEKWNKQVELDRQERRKRQIVALEELAFSRIGAVDKKHSLKILKASENIKLQKALSTTFITAETLDSAIDHAIANPTDHNYAIDSKGNIYEGCDTKITLTKDDNKANANVKSAS